MLDPPDRKGIVSLLGDLWLCLRFFSRLPLPQQKFETDPANADNFIRALGMAPLAGAILGLLSALVLALGGILRLPALISATLALATLTFLSGALHEDGLADSADGLGGGKEKEKALAIMRDSRIGSFGASALIFTIILRVLALGSIATLSLWQAALALIFASGASRCLALLPARLLPPARDNGAGFSTASPLMRASFRRAARMALVLVLLPWFDGTPLGTILFALLLATSAVYLLCRIAVSKIGGQTGDIAGAAQQIAETLFLMVLSSGTIP